MSLVSGLTTQIRGTPASRKSRIFAVDLTGQVIRRDHLDDEVRSNLAVAILDISLRESLPPREGNIRYANLLGVVRENLEAALGTVDDSQR